MARRDLTSLCASAAATLAGFTLISSAAATPPTAAAPHFEGAKNGTAVVLDFKTGAVLYVWRGLPAPDFGRAKNGTAVVLDPKTGAVLYVWRGLPGRWSPWPGVRRHS